MGNSLVETESGNFTRQCRDAQVKSALWDTWLIYKPNSKDVLRIEYPCENENC